MKLAMFYAHWKAFGESWSTPFGLENEFKSRGHEVTVYNLYHANGAFLPQHKVRTYSGDCFNRFSLDYKNGYKPDALLLCDYGPFDYVGCDKRFYPDIPFILEAADTPQSFRMHLQKVRKFHSIVTPDYQSTELFKQFNLDAYWMTHWADHRIFHPHTEIEEQFDCVTTCGSRAIMNSNGGCLTDKIKAALGDAFNNERYFYGEDHAKRLCMGKIVFQCSQFKEITRRIFEGMACGKMMLTDRLPLETKLHELLIDGQDIVYYDNAEDAIEKIRYYASHNDERLRIAKNGYDKVMANHTVAQRVDMFEAIATKVQHDIL